jgi:hypothetical protein
MADVRSLELGRLHTWRGDERANLGFASVFDEILARGSSIYRGFESMISCTCRTPSPIPPTRLGFDFDRISLGFFGWGRKTAQVRYLTWG